MKFGKTHYISEITQELEGQRVVVAGWVYRKRDLGSVQFIVLRDSTGILQMVAKQGQCDEKTFLKAKRAGIEASLRVKGIVRRDPRAPGGVELVIEELELIGPSEDFPIKGREGLEFLLDHRHLYLRSRKLQAVLKIRAEAIRAMHEWFQKNGFIETEAPTIIEQIVEGGATLFELDYFGKKVYLTQSSQLYLEAFITAFENVYTIQPSFRAERSRTWRHLTEFWHAEAEMAWADLDDMMDVVEALVKYVSEKVVERRSEELEFLKRKFEPPEGRFPRISYDEALEIARRKGSKLEWGEDLDTPSERLISLEFETPFFVHRYPRKARAFYHMPDPKRPEVLLCADLLAPEGRGEIVGGGQRIHDYNLLLERIKEFGLDPSRYTWYLDLRKYGTIPHSGFGLGVERTVTWIAGIRHIRDAIGFPRTPTRTMP